MSTQGHTIEVTPSSDRVVVTVHNTVVATSTRPLVLTETGYPPRYYLPPDDVRTDLLTPSPTTSHCPFKGDAVYWSVNADGTVANDVVWSYPEPYEAVQGIAGHLAFWSEQPGVTLNVEKP
jgi:uncharacterized protein (DUF427 family)